MSRLDIAGEARRTIDVIRERRHRHRAERHGVRLLRLPRWTR